jgi:signal transduction histidine kinase
MFHSWQLLALILTCSFFTGITYAQIPSDQNETALSVEIPGAGMDNTTGSSLSLKEKISEITDFVKKGSDYAKNNPKDVVLAQFNDINGEFVQGERYIFAYDINGTTLALPYQQDLIGKNRMSLVDSNGMELLKSMAYVAGYGGGYLYYIYPNPAQNFIEQVKFTYIEPVDETWFIGSGFYIPHFNIVMDKEAISQLVARVERAQVFAEEEGKEKASMVFNDKNDTWAKDNTYIFSYDFNGTTLAMPYQPESIGKNRWDYTDKYGIHTARLEIETAKAGGGFTYVVYYNPESNRDELKFCYVLPIQNDWLVGSGIYTGQDVSDG